MLKNKCRLNDLHLFFHLLFSQHTFPIQIFSQLQKQSQALSNVYFVRWLNNKNLPFLPAIPLPFWVIFFSFISCTILIFVCFFSLQMLFKLSSYSPQVNNKLYMHSISQMVLTNSLKLSAEVKSKILVLFLSGEGMKMVEFK